MTFAVEADHAGYSSASSTYSGPVPGTIAEGDLILAQLVSNTSSNDAITMPDANWHVLVDNGSGAYALTGSVGYFWCYHLVTSAEEASPPGSWDFTLGTARTGNVIISRITGHDPADPFNTAVSSNHASYSNSTPLVVSGVTTDTDGCLLAGGATVQSATTASITEPTSPSAWTEDDSTCTLTLGRGQDAAHVVLGSAGATGDISWYQSYTSLAGAAWHVAINPASGTPAEVSPAVVAGTAAITAPAVSTGATVSPVTVAGTAAITAPGVSTGATVSPASVSAVSAITAPTVSAGATVNPASVSAVSAIDAPTVSTGVTVSPSTVAGTAAITAPAVSTGATVSPATVEATAAIDAPTVSTGATVSLSTVAGTAAIDAPTVSTSAATEVGPAVVAAVSAITAPAVSTGATVGPATVLATAAIATPAVSAGATITLTTVGAVAAIATPTVTTGSPTPAASVTGVSSRYVSVHTLTSRYTSTTGRD